MCIYLYINLYLWGHDHLFYGNNVLTMAHVAPKASVPGDLTSDSGANVKANV